MAAIVPYVVLRDFVPAFVLVSFNSRVYPVDLFAFGSPSSGSGTAVLYFSVFRFCALRAQKRKTLNQEAPFLLALAGGERHGYGIMQEVDA
jgi:hypothetical protein